MKSLISVILVASIIGGATAAGTIYWQKLHPPVVVKPADEDKDKIKDEYFEEKKIVDSLLEATPQPEPEPTPEPPVAVRPPFVEGADEAGHLVVTLNERLAAAEKKERWLQDRQEALKLIFSDIRSEQFSMTQLRRQFTDELDSASKSVQESLRAALDERDLLRRELESVTKPTAADPATTDEDGDPPVPAKPVALPNDPTAAAINTGLPTASPKTDPASLKRMGAIYDSMPADVVADVFQQLAKKGQLDAVVPLLRAMKDRQAAKVMTAIATTDPTTAAALTEHLKRAQ